MKIPLNTYLLQVETVGPEGGKIILLLIFLVIIIPLLFFILKKSKLKLPFFSKGIKVSLSKNKAYHPSVITLKVSNFNKKAITIQHPIIRFKRGRKKKAYKIKAVNSTQIYPLYLEAGKTHNLPIVLLPFYEFDKNLKRYSSVRIEFNYNNDQKKKTKYILLKSTLFRKV